MAILTIDDVRVFLNDYPEANRLIKRVQFTPERIAKAIQFMIREWNETVPIVNVYTEETFPYKTALLYGVISWLFSGESTFEERNHLTYQSGGLTIDDSNRTQAYLKIAEYFLSKFKDLMERQKKLENIDNGWGSIGSGYGSTMYV